MPTSSQPCPRHDVLARHKPWAPHVVIVAWLAAMLIPLPGARADEAPSLQVEGRLVLSGSTSLANLTTLWAEAFQMHHPTIALTIASPGSAAGLAALVNGTAYAVLLGGEPTAEAQQRRFREQYGFPLATAAVASDGIAVFVNRSNPLKRIELAQLDAIYSRTRRCGKGEAIRYWFQLGIKDELARQPIVAVGLGVETAAYRQFRRQALCGGDYRDDFQALNGPAQVEAAIASEEAAMGFASSALRAPDLRALAIGKGRGLPAVAPNAENIRAGRYPLARRLYVAWRKAPGEATNPALQAFIDFAHSAEGQEIAARAGYVGMPASP